MKNREIYQRDPNEITLLNNGVATMTDALDEDERRTLRFELEHFVCEGEYQKGLVRILDSYLSNQNQPEQPAAWVSGFFGSGKSHLAKMLRFLWTDHHFPEDGASARGLARLPDDVTELFTELTTLGRRTYGLRAAAGTLGAGAGDSVRLALLGFVFKSANLPESFPQAEFCLWLIKNNIYDQVRTAVEAEGRDFRRELNDLYVSPVIAKALLKVDPDFARSEKDARAALRDQFPRPKDITTDGFVASLQETLAPEGELPCTVLILDEIQQYIGEDSGRSYAVQEVVEACSKRFGGRLMLLGTGQTALSSTPALQRLQGRFTVNVELSDADVETVTRRVVLAKRPDRTNDLTSTLDDNTGEINRHLVNTRIGPRNEDDSVLVEDYPLLPVRRRFWEHMLRAVDRAGTAGQLRTQLRIVYDAIRRTADDPVGTVVPADFLFEEISPNLLQSGVLLREVHETIIEQDDGTPDGRLKSRLCALTFLIRKLPMEAGIDIGVRANEEALADLMVEDLAQDGAVLRGQIPALLDELTAGGTLLKLDDGYSLQTRESSEWENEFRNRQTKLTNDLTQMSSKRTQLQGAAIQEAISSVRLLQGKCKEPRKLTLHFGAEPSQSATHEVPVWVRDGWGADEQSVVAEARADGSNCPVIHVFIPKSRAEALARVVAAQAAANETLDYKGVPSTPEGIEARQGMEMRRTEAANIQRSLVAAIVGDAKVYQGGGSERMELTLQDKIREAANASLDRLFQDFGDADDNRWAKVIERTRKGDGHPLEALDYNGKTEDHRVCSAVLAFVSSGKKGKEVRDHFSAPPYGWPRDAIDAALISLFGAGHLRANANGSPLKSRELDQAKVSVTYFRVESAIINTQQRIRIRKLFQSANVPCKPNEEGVVAAGFLAELGRIAQSSEGDAPLPARPDTSHLQDLQSLTGNEQLVGILDRYDELQKNIEDWTRAGNLAEKRFPAYRRLLSLACHAKELDVASVTQPQINAISANRNLLADADPVPDLARMLTDALRTALAKAETGFSKVYDEELKHLVSTESWQKIEQAERDRILKESRLEKITKGTTGTEQEVLESLGHSSLDAWRDRTAALPQLFAEARIKADRLVEPKTYHVKLRSTTLRTPEEVKDWLNKTEQTLLEQVERGPVVVS